jgi:hypothetical protein
MYSVQHGRRGEFPGKASAESPLSCFNHTRTTGGFLDISVTTDILRSNILSLGVEYDHRP